MLLSWGIYGIGLLMFGLAADGSMVAVGQFLAGFGCNPAVTLCYSFLNEQCLGKKRELYSVAIQLALAVGECLIALLFLPDLTWRQITLGMLGLNLLILLCMTYLVESPKFLLPQDTQKTLDSLNSIARKNNKPLLAISQLPCAPMNKDSSISTLDLFRFGSLRMVALCTGAGFLAIQVIYYSTLLSLDGLGFSKLINQEILGVSEFIGYLAVEFVIGRLRRRLWSVLGLGVSSGLCLLLALLPILLPS